MNAGVRFFAAALIALTAGSAQACPSPACATCVPLKPRAWMPSGLPPVAQASSGGLWISRDPVDGAMAMPPPEAAPGIANATSAAQNSPVSIERKPDGTLIALLDDRWANYAVATIGADGRPVWTCVPGRQGVEQFLARPGMFIVAPVKWEER
jgi:hypothetical protein